MDYVTLGNSDLKVSKMGQGVWQASDSWKGDDEQIVRAIKRAGELGVTLLDTAEVYGKGRSEQVVGRAIKEVGRRNFVVATKVYGAHLRHDELLKAAQVSLRRLGISEIDLYQVHWPDPWEQIPLKETMKALERLFLEGRIRAIGVSNFAVRDLEEARSFLSRTDIVSNQVRYNLLQRSIEEEVLPYCKSESISIIAYSPLAQGVLTGKYNSTNIPRGDIRDDNALFATKNIVRLEPLIARLRQIAQRRGFLVAQVALKWLLDIPEVIPIPGAKNPNQAEENVGSTRVELTQKDVAELDEASRAAKIDYYPDAPTLQLEASVS